MQPDLNEIITKKSKISFTKFSIIVSITLALLTISLLLNGLSYTYINHQTKIIDGLKHELTDLRLDFLTITDSEGDKEVLDILPYDPTDYSMNYGNLITMPGVTWLNEPKYLGDLKFFELIENDQYPTGFNFKYYQIGEKESNPIVYVSLPCEGLCGGEHVILVVEGEKKAVIVKKNSSFDFSPDNHIIRFAANVVVDVETKFDALLPAERILVNNGELTIERELNPYHLQGQYLDLFSETEFNLQNQIEHFQRKVAYIDDTKWGPLYRGIIRSYSGVEEEVKYKYAIRLPGGLYLPYDESLPGFSTGVGVPKIQWLEGGTNTETYRTGCLFSSGPKEMLVRLVPPEIELVGKTDTGEKVYNLVNEESSLIKETFSLFGGVIYQQDTELPNSSSQAVTVADFINNRGLLILEDKGRQLVLFNNMYISCER